MELPAHFSAEQRDRYTAMLEQSPTRRQHRPVTQPVTVIDDTCQHRGDSLEPVPCRYCCGTSYEPAWHCDLHAVPCVEHASPVDSTVLVCDQCNDCTT